MTEADPKTIQWETSPKEWSPEHKLKEKCCYCKQQFNAFSHAWNTAGLVFVLLLFSWNNIAVPPQWGEQACLENPVFLFFVLSGKTQ